MALAWTVDKGLFLDSVGNDNTHPIGEVIEIAATFAGTGTGTPRIPFTLGTARKNANFLHRGWDTICANLAGGERTGSKDRLQVGNGQNDE